MIEHREHTILLNGKRVNKGMEIMNSLPLPPVVFSYATLQGKSLPTSPAKHRSAILVPRPFRTLQFLSYFFVKKYLLVGASSMLWTGQWISESVSQ